jgi:hypothetical protein
MIEYDNQTFRKLYDRGAALCLENIRFENCAANGCGIGPAIFENVTVEGLNRNTQPYSDCPSLAVWMARK